MNTDCHRVPCAATPMPKQRQKSSYKANFSVYSDFDTYVKHEAGITRVVRFAGL